MYCAWLDVYRVGGAPDFKHGLGLLSGPLRLDTLDAAEGGVLGDAGDERANFDEEALWLDRRNGGGIRFGNFILMGSNSSSEKSDALRLSEACLWSSRSHFVRR